MEQNIEKFLIRCVNKCVKFLWIMAWEKNNVIRNGMMLLRGCADENKMYTKIMR